MPYPIYQKKPSFRDVVFAKTAAGQSELARRTSQLSGQQRSLLIVIDGKRDYNALQRIIPEKLLEAGLYALRDLELIATPAVSDAGHGEPEKEAKKHGVDPFRQAKQLMMHSAEGYLGPMAGALVRQIAAANDEKQVRSAMGHWHMAMRESKYGRADVNELIVRVSALLHEEPLAKAHSSLLVEVA